MSPKVSALPVPTVLSVYSRRRRRDRQRSDIRALAKAMSPGARSHPRGDRSIGGLLGPTLRLIWANGQHVIGLPYMVDNHLLWAVRPGNRPRFDDCDRNRPPDELVHCATLLEGQAV
jgi:hypothetical protein